MDIINYSRLNKDNEILIPKNSIVGKSDSILIIRVWYTKFANH